MAIREQTIIDNIIARLGLIQGSPDYHTELGTNVFEWRENKPFESHEVPAAVVRDVHDDMNVQPTHPHDVHFLRVEIDIIAAATTSTAAVTRQMKFDVIKAIGVDKTWSDQAINTELVEATTNVHQEKNIVEGATIVILIHYRTDKWGES